MLVWNQKTFLIKRGFEYALREENRTLFNKMLSNKEEYADCISAKGENFSTEVLFMNSKK
jgi:hypothetical protein